MSFCSRIKPAPVNGGFRMAGYWIWCGSAIRGEDELYHLFASRWPKNVPFFNGYLFYSEIVHAVSRTPEGPYTFQDVVLGDRGSSFWDGRMTHNPTIRKVDDTYLLFYIGATFEGDKPDGNVLSQDDVPLTRTCYQSIRIGLATAQSLNGPWQRSDQPVLMPRFGKWDSSVVTNPAPCVLKNNAIYLYYRSNTPEGLRIGLAAAPSFSAPFVRMKDEPIISFANGGHIEDPFIWQQGDHFEMIAKDITGSIAGEKHAGIHAWSTDGLSWQLFDPPKAYSRRVVWDNGDSTIQGSLERPQLLFHDGVPTHLFAATADGPGGFRKAENTWNMVLPLDCLEPLKDA